MLLGHIGHLVLALTILGSQTFLRHLLEAAGNKHARTSRS